MADPPPARDSAHILRAQLALGLSQAELGKLLGLSRRTILRRVGQPNAYTPAEKRTIVQRLHAKDPAMAATVAAGLGETRESFGVTPAPAAPSAPPPIGARDLADSIVCAAAEATGMAPQAIRPALIAAFERAASVRLGVDEVRAALAPLPATKKRS